MGSSKPPALSVLLVEDDAAVAEAVREGLTARGLSVRHAPDLALAWRLLVDERFDAVILDLTLPDGDGMDLVARVRASGSDVPILMLTARSAVEDRVAGLRQGADDYLCKPFSMDELAARLTAILRRSRSAQRHMLRYEDVELDLVRRQVRRGDVELSLSTREAELLAYLIRHADKVLSRERILQDVWGSETEEDSNVLNVYINYLRNKIDAGSPRLIHTVRGVGYFFSTREPEEMA